MHHYHTKLPDYRIYSQSHIYEGMIQRIDVLQAVFRIKSNLEAPCPRNYYSICPPEDYASSFVTKYLYHMSNTISEQCTLLLLLNLAKPQWIPVGCHEKIVNHVICFSKRKFSNHNHTLDTSKTYICKRASILYKGWCFLFFSCVSNPCIISNIISTCEKLNFLNVFDVKKSLGLFNVIFESISLQNMFFIALNKEKRKLHYFYAKRNTRSWMETVLTKSNINKKSYAYFSCKFKKYKHNINNELVYRNSNSHFISLKFLCDRANYNHMKNNINSICNTSFLFFLTISGNYLPYSQQIINENEHLHLEDCKPSHCHIGANNEMLDQHTIKLSCENSQSNVYNFSHMCVFRLNNNFDLIPCKTGSHIEQCKDFECNVHFKCPGYYCIPWGYICDGKWDCPDGYDESVVQQCGINRTCTDMFKCKDSQLCLHLEDICNVYSDCPLGDDELFCKLGGGHCFPECICYQYAMVCNKGVINHRKLPRLPYIYYHLTFLNSLVTSVLRNDAVLIVNLKYNSITEICYKLHESKVLTLLDLSHNVVEKLNSKCFSDHFYIRKIILTNNSLSNIQEKAFNNLQKLYLVDLSVNNLNTLPFGTFTNVEHLIILILHGNSLQNIQFNMFKEVSIDIIHSNNFEVCCIVHYNLKCTQPNLWYNSCGNLLINIRLTFSFITVSILILFANCILLFLLIQSYGSSGKPYLMISISLIIANMFLLIVFMILWSSDLYYGHIFVPKKYTWKKSIICNIVLSGFIFYKLFQPFILTILSLGRLMVVLNPFQSKFKSLNYTLKIIIIGFINIAFLSVIFGTIIKFHTLPNNLCLPFADPTNNNLIIWIMTVVIVVVEFVTIVGTLRMYAHMIQEVKKSQNYLRSTKTVTSNSHIITHVTLLSLSELLCWIPAGVIFVTVLIVDKYPVELIYWTTALIFPLNAIIIPIILSLNIRSKLTVFQNLRNITK